MTAEEVAHACGSEHCSCVPHLRAEIERLRAQRVLSNEDFARSFDMGLVAGERRERAAVVAYLRAEASRAGASPDERMILRWAANYIERGEHRREEGT